MNHHRTHSMFTLKFTFFFPCMFNYLSLVFGVLKKWSIAKGTELLPRAVQIMNGKEGLLWKSQYPCLLVHPSDAS